MKEQIIMVAAGTLRQKNSYKAYDTENLYLNYGLLGLATNLSKSGHSVKMFQADDRTPEELFWEIQQTTAISSQYPLFLSIPSFFNLKWAEEFIFIVKSQCKIPVVAGGRWIVDRNLDWLKSKLPQVDFFIRGCPDETIQHFLNPAMWSLYKGECQYQAPFSSLDYKLLHNYKKYQPIIEVSRGCPGGCSFCLESYYKACHPKLPQTVLDEAEKICAEYQTESLNFYFEGAIFCPSVSWAQAFREEYQKRGMKFKFRMQSRVDAICTESIEILSHVGLKVLDVGLESACPEQLVRMGKTKNPDQYLRKAEELLYAAWESGVWCKLNILLYAGENAETIEKTKQWLRAHRLYFKGISCNPLMLYLNGEDTWSYVDMLEKQAGTSIDRNRLLEDGYMKFDLSKSMPEKEVQQVVNSFYQEFMTREDYMALKEITYTPRECTV